MYVCICTNAAMNTENEAQEISKFILVTFTFKNFFRKICGQIFFSLLFLVPYLTYRLIQKIIGNNAIVYFFLYLVLYYTLQFNQTCLGPKVSILV